MSTDTTYIKNFINDGAVLAFAAPGLRLAAGARLVDAQVSSPLALGARTQMGPDVAVGRYVGINSDSYIARADIGSFCAFGSRVSVNPLNHPMDWLSIHEFQYHETAYDWDEDFLSVKKLPHCAPQTNPRVTIGNDVWIGHNATIMEGVIVGSGAVIGVNSVVTKDVPPYAIVAGIPAQIKRYRFDEKTIERVLSVQWWNLDLALLRDVTFDDINAAIAQIEEIRASLQGACT